MATPTHGLPFQGVLPQEDLLVDQPNEFAAREVYTPPRTYEDADHHAATVLQTAWRGRKVRQTLNRASPRDEATFEGGHVAKSRSQYLQQFVDKRKEKREVLDQSKKLARKVPHFYGEVSEPEGGYQEEHHTSAAKIQHAFREHLQRSEAQTEGKIKVKLFKPPEGGYQDAHQAAATTIQAAYRGHKTRSELQAQAQYKEAHLLSFQEGFRDPRTLFPNTHGLDLPLDEVWEYDGPDHRYVKASRNPEAFALKQKYEWKLQFMQRENTKLFRQLNALGRERNALLEEVRALEQEHEDAMAELRFDHASTLQGAEEEHQRALEAKDQQISTQGTTISRFETAQSTAQTTQRTQAQNNRFRTRLAITALIALNVLTYIGVAYTMLTAPEKGWFQRTGEFFGFI